MAIGILGLLGIQCFFNSHNSNLYALANVSNSSQYQTNSVSSIPPSLSWINQDRDSLNISKETRNPISGNTSIRVDIPAAKSPRDAGANGSWSVITTSPMPILAGVLYNYSMELSAKDVNQLHSKVYYLDSSMDEINSNFLSDGTDGTFQKNFSRGFVSPNNTKYQELQLWVKPSIGKNASFLIDNVRAGENHTYLFDDDIPIENSDNASMGNENIIHPILAVADKSFVIEPIYTGLKFPTSMSFLGDKDILVLEKDDGTVKRIVNGNLIKEPLLDVNVSSNAERGLLGIAVSEQKITNSSVAKKYVFLYYTESRKGDVATTGSGGLSDIPGKGPLGNRVYRYELVDNKLINPVLILDLPAEPKPNHQGVVQ
jgi:hypothetical protein